MTIHFLPGAYELSSTYERGPGGPARGARQDELGAELARKLRERMKTEMRAAGWQVVTHTREGQDIWQYTGSCLPSTRCNAYSNNRYTDSTQRQLHLQSLWQGNNAVTDARATPALL